jgi:hypothetical protein
MRLFAICGLAVGLGIVWLGCSSKGSEGASTDEAITASGCAVFNNQTGKAITPEELRALNDPVAKSILNGAACPTSYSAVLKKLKTTDAQRCKDVNDKPQVDGLSSFFVSETAQLTSNADKAAADGFRVVVAKTCSGRKNDEMLFSLAAAAGGVTETNVEMIGKDATTGVYNFYEVLDRGQWVFYGNSLDLIGDGYTCAPSGYCVANNSKKASSPSGKSCASCHVGGGLVMKELESPWLHWTVKHVNGSEKVAKKFPDRLGAQQNGQDLEFQVVESSFDAYCDKRVAFLATKGAAELLRPLFCTLDVNLDSFSDPSDPNANASTTLIVDALLDVRPVAFDFGVYKALKKEVAQRVIGFPATVDDVAEAFTYPKRGNLDESYTNALLRAKLVDEELVSDVLDVDFTRPIFSGARCGILESLAGKTTDLDAQLAAWANEPDATKKAALTAAVAAAIPQTLTSALQGSTKTGDVKLVANLTDPKATAEAHKDEAENFIDACNARLSDPDPAKKKAALKDLMTYGAHVRRTMRRDVKGFNGQQLLEPGPQGDNKMVFDDLPDTDAAFDPLTCKL